MKVIYSEDDLIRLAREETKRQLEKFVIDDAQYKTYPTNHIVVEVSFGYGRKNGNNE